jgi:hypothetical protein
MSRIVVSVVVAFDSAPDGLFPGVELIAAETSKAVTDVFSGAGLKLWGIDKPIPPVVPPAPPVPITGKQWRVAYLATLHATPAAGGMFQGYAQVGEIMTQVGDAQPPDWIQTTRGWLHSNQVMPL